jgi:hypothetical protein
VTSLNLATEPFKVIWRQKNRQNVTLPLHISVGRIRVFGDSKGEQLQEVFDAGDTEFRVLFERDVGGWTLEWQGFVSPSLWKDNPYRQTDVVELEAIDGLALLEDRSLELTQDTDLYTVAREILRGLHELDVAATMEWYPYREGNQLNADELPLAELLAQEKAFDELEPIEGEEGFESTGKRSQRRALEAILERFGMELFQSRGEWRMRQRHRIQFDGTISVWADKDAVDNNDRTTRDLNRTLGSLIPRERPRGFVQRLRETQSVHTYDQLGDLIKNGIFEDEGLSGWKTFDADVEVQTYADSKVNKTGTQENNQLLRVPFTDPVANDQPYDLDVRQDVPAILHDAGPRSALRFQFDLAALNSPETRIALSGPSGSRYYVQTRSADVSEEAKPAEDGRLVLSNTLDGNDGTLLIPKGTRLYFHKPDGSRPQDYSKEITLSEPAYAGDEVLKGSISQTIESGAKVYYWVWSDEEIVLNEGQTDEQRYWGLREYPNQLTTRDEIIPQRLQLPVHTPQGTNLAGGGLSIGWVISGPQAGDGDLNVDNVSSQLAIAGEPVGQTSYTAADTGQSGREIQITQLLGDGPTAEHPRALQLPGVEVTRDWKIGPYVYQEYPSGKLLEQVTAESAMRQQRDTLQRRTHEVHLRNEEVWPQDVFTIDGDLYTVIALERTFGSPDVANVQLVRLKDAGTSGLKRTYKMESAEGGGVEGTTGGGGNGGGGDGSSETTWGLVKDKPAGILSRSGEGGTVTLGQSDIASALSHDPGLSDGIQTTVREEGSATDEALVTEQAVREEVDQTTVSVDFGDDDSTNITPLSQISVTGDADNIFSGGDETNELEIAVGQQWPDADKLDGYESGAFVPGTGSNLRVTTSLPNPKVQTVTQPTFGQVTLNKQAAALDESVRADRSLAGGEGIQPVGDLTQDREVAVNDTVARTDRDETFDEDVTVIGDFFVEGQETVLNTQTVETTDNLIFLNAGQQGAGVTSGFAGFEADRGTEEPVKLVFDEVTDLGRVGIHYKTLSYSGLSGSFDLHEEVEGQSSGATGVVWNDDGSTLSLKGRTGSFTGGETVEGQSSGASATVGSTTQIDNTQALATREDSPSTGGVPFFNSNNRLFETTEDFKVVGSQSNEFYNGTEVQAGIGIGHPDYVAELSHWYITPGGLGDFRTLLADELRVEAFIAEVEEALAGADFLTKSFATLDQPFEVPSSSPVGTRKDLTVQDLDGLGALAVFNNETDKDDDTLRLRIVDRSDGGLTVADIWLRAVAGSYTDNGDGTQTWTVEILQAGDQGIGAGLTAPEGSIVLDYGVPGDFLIERSVLNPDSGDIAPYDRMIKWTDPDGNRIPDPGDFEVLNLRGRLDGLPKARATGFGVYSETARFTEDVAVGDLEAADAGDESGSYLKFTKSGGLKVVTQGGDVESRTAQNQSDLRLLARRVAQEQESRAGIELHVGQNAAEIKLNAEVIGDDSEFSQSTLSLQASQNEDDISANSTAVADLGAIVGDGQNLAEADLTLTASQNTDDISSNDSAIADLSAVVGDDSKFSESTLSLQASQNEDDASSNASAIADLEATVGDDSEFSKSTLSLQAGQNEADLKLLARRVTQETEARAGVEANVGENAATIQLHAEVLNENGLGASTDITSRVSTAEDDIGINASDISANATDIADNVDAINLNAGDIDSNATAINTLEAQVGDGSISAGADLTQAANVNTGDISDNEGNISQNATAITDLENYVGIDEDLAAESSLTLLANANKSDTDQNASDISANATDIADNSDAINLNAGDIDSNATAITDIENHVGIDENLAAEANLTLLANANKSDTDENATAITQLENRVGVGEDLEVESNLTLAANQNAANIKLLAKRVTQEQETRSGIELNVGKNSADIEANATVIGDDGLFSQSTLSLHASETETRFESSVQYTDNNNDVGSRASISLLAGPGGSEAILAGENILLDGNTQVSGNFSVTDIDPNAALKDELFSGSYTDLTDKPTLGDLSEIDVIQDTTFIGNGVIVTEAVVADAITVDEIDLDSFWAEDATIANTLTMGSEGKIVNNPSSPTDYTIDGDGITLVAGDPDSGPLARRISWTENGTEIARIAADNGTIESKANGDEASGYSGMAWYAKQSSSSNSDSDRMKMGMDFRPGGRDRFEFLLPDNGGGTNYPEFEIGKMGLDDRGWRYYPNGGMMVWKNPRQADPSDSYCKNLLDRGEFALYALDEDSSSTTGDVRLKYAERKPDGSISRKTIRD